MNDISNLNSSVVAGSSPAGPEEKVQERPVRPYYSDVVACLFCGADGHSAQECPLICPVCGGSGKTWGAACEECDGTGALDADSLAA